MTEVIALDRKRIEGRRGRNIAKIAAAGKLLTLVYDGCATDTSAPWPTDRWRREHLGRSTRAAVGSSLFGS